MHAAAEDARRGDAGLIENVPEGLSISPIDRQVLHVDGLFRLDWLRTEEMEGGQAQEERGCRQTLPGGWHMGWKRRFGGCFLL